MANTKPQKSLQELFFAFLLAADSPERAGIFQPKATPWVKNMSNEFNPEGVACLINPKYNVHHTIRDISQETF